MRFTDYYAEASCTAGRANFITGELPIRTGMTTVGQAGSPIGIPAQAVTIPGGWLGEKTAPDVPHLTNLRLDPFERTGWPENLTAKGSVEYFEWFKFKFWRFVFVQQQVAKLAMTAVELPPMQKGASFNLDAVKAKIEAARAAMGK
jgi:hypothetical protein